MIVKARGYTTNKEQLETGMGSFIKVDAEREFQKWHSKGQMGKKKLKMTTNRIQVDILRKFKKKMD